MNDTSDATIEAALKGYLERRYTIQVEKLKRLERGVFRADLVGSKRWIIRVFPKDRPLEQVKGDEAVLRFLEEQQFPAERCANADPISFVNGRGMIITEYIEGVHVIPSKHTLFQCGEMLGRLHQLPYVQGGFAHASGALHHYVHAGGGPKQEISAAQKWLTSIEGKISLKTTALYNSLLDQLDAADDCHDLPQTLIHPDPVLKNILATEGESLVFIDWSGAGIGPRLASIAVLIFSSAFQNGKVSPTHISAVIEGYRSHIQLEEVELERLGAVLQNRPLIFSCWRFYRAVLAGHIPMGKEWWWSSKRLNNEIAKRALADFQ